MIKNLKKYITGILVLTVLLGNVASASEADFPESDQEGKITLHSFDVSSFKNLSEGTGEKLDEANIPGDAKKQEGVIFTIQRLDETSVNEITVNTPADPAFAKREGRTNTNGEVTFDNLPKGYYLVTQEESSAYSAQLSQFIVMMPMKLIDGDGAVKWNYDVHAYPKNVKNSGLTKHPEKENSVVGVGDEVVWHVNYEVGADIKKETEDGTVYAKDFYITDTMDSRLTYIEGSSVFETFNRDGQPAGIDIIEGVHYIETFDRNTNTVIWTYTDAGVRALADNQIGRTTVTITTIVNESALGTVTVLWNNAFIDFTNADDDPYHLEVFNPDSDKNGANVPKAYMGSITIDKHEKNLKQTKLAGVTFKLARTQQDAVNGVFFREETTDEKGYAMFTALGAGDYWLMETKAAEGYELLDKPVKVTIGSSPSEANVTVSIENERIQTGTTTPGGGGTGVGSGSKGGGSTAKTGDAFNLLSIIAIMCVSVSVIFILIKKRRANSDNTNR